MNPMRRELRMQTVCLLILCTIAIAGALYWLRPVMVPLVLAVFFALGLTPLIELQVSYLRAPRWLAVVGTGVLGLLILGLLGILVSTSVGQLAAHAGTYQTHFTHLVQAAIDALPFDRFGIDPAEQFRRFSQASVGMVGRVLIGMTNAIVDLLSQGLLVTIFVLYLLVGSGRRSGTPGAVWSEVEIQIERYLAAKTFTSVSTGVLVGSILLLLGIDLAVVFGLLAFLLNFIPNAGSIVATLLPLPVVLVNPDISTTVAVLAIALPGVVQFTLGNIVEPRLIGKTLDLHPLAILIALIFWGMLWGIVGMLLATPMTAVAKMLLEKSDVTAPVAHLLAGRTEAR